MYLCRRAGLWLGCSAMAAAFVVAEEWALRAARLSAPAPLAITVGGLAPAEPAIRAAEREAAPDGGEQAFGSGASEQADDGRAAVLDQAIAADSVLVLHEQSVFIKWPMPEPAAAVPRDQPAVEHDRSHSSKSAKQPDKHDSRTARRICRVTAYSDRGLTASGTRSGVGQCAAPVDIPFGSKLYIPALGRTFIVTDRTHPRFQHNTVDLFIPSSTACRHFGRKYLKCEFVISADPPDYGEVTVR